MPYELEQGGILSIPLDPSGTVALADNSKTLLFGHVTTLAPVWVTFCDNCGGNKEMESVSPGVI